MIAIPVLILFVALVVTGCGGRSPAAPTSPPTPSPSSTPTPAPTPPTVSSYQGRVIATGSGSPISGATVTMEGKMVTSDGAGSFTVDFDTAPAFPVRIKIDAAGHVVRETSFRPSDTVDLIALAPPFTLKLYTELVRGTVDADGPNPLSRWTTPPAFGINTLTEDGGSVDPAMLDIVEQAIRDSFPLWTGGAINYSRIERGAFDEGRGGWIVIRFFERGRVCANVGNWRAVGNRDQIASSTMTFFLRECACGSRRIQSRIVAHEVGHALGFEHVTNSDLTMYPYVAQPCSRSDRPLVSPIEQYHAAIAYRRPPGNRDPDID